MTVGRDRAPRASADAKPTRYDRVGRMKENAKSIKEELLAVAEKLDAAMAMLNVDNESTPSALHDLQQRVVPLQGRLLALFEEARRFGQLRFRAEDLLKKLPLPCEPGSEHHNEALADIIDELDRGR